MAQEVDKCDTNNMLLIENADNIKEEYEDNNVEDKVLDCETGVDINGISNDDLEIQDYVKDDIMKEWKISLVDNIKTELSSSEIHERTSNNEVKIENEFITNDIKVEYNAKGLSCSHCHEDYQDYCTKCEMLVHILNRNTCGNTDSRSRKEAPNNVLEIREIFGHFGIFALKKLPKGVKFGPFGGLATSECVWKIKKGRFIVGDDKSELLNWMQYINSAKNISEQNLSAFQYEDNIYYRSVREIHKGEELLVYFGEEYRDSFSKEVEMVFVPVSEKDVQKVFACTVCCLGFRSKECLIDHKIICPSETKGKVMKEVSEITQCSFCKIYLEKQEYLEYHMDYCREKYDRQDPLSLRDDQTTWMECEYKSCYKSNSEIHINGLRVKVTNYKCMKCGFETIYKSSLKEHINGKHLKTTNYKCEECDYETSYKSALKKHIETKHVQGAKYKCKECEYKTYYPSHLTQHMKGKHLKEVHSCTQCEFKTTYIAHLKKHINVKHLGETDFKCKECDFRTKYKSALKLHISGKHLNETNYKCMDCDYKANYKLSLKRHIETKHLKKTHYKCTECEYETRYHDCLKMHIRTHDEVKRFKCLECGFETHYKYRLKTHTNAKHHKKI